MSSTYARRLLAGAAMTACLMLAALPSNPAVAGGILLYEIGTADVGLASAGYGARAQDASTLLTNPAGMTRLAGTQATAGLQLLYGDFDFSIGSGTSPGLGGDDGGNPIGWFPGGSGFVSYSVSPQLKVGFGVAGNFGLALSYDDDWAGRYYVQEATLMGVSLLPAVAYRVNENLSLGASVNAMYGKLKQEVAINNVRETLPDGQLKVDDSEWGWGFNLGLLYEVDARTRFGLVYNSQVKLDFSSNVELSGLGPGLERLLDRRGLLGAQLDLGIKVPQGVMASVFHQVDDRWAVLGNVGWQQWSKFGEVEVGIADTSDPRSLTTEVGFDDTWHFAVGAQYRLSDPWQLNFGIAYDSGFQDGDVSPILPVDSAWRFGAGAQNQVSKTFSWGFAGEYVYGGTLDVSKQSLLPVDLGGRGDLDGSFENTGMFFIAANFNWRF